MQQPNQQNNKQHYQEAQPKSKDKQPHQNQITQSLNTNKSNQYGHQLTTKGTSNHKQYPHSQANQKSKQAHNQVSPQHPPNPKLKSQINQRY